MNSYHWLHRSLGGVAFIAAFAMGGVGHFGSVSAEAADTPAIEQRYDDQDPWEPFNEKMFWFNRQADRFLLKPIATGYDWVLPDSVQNSVKSSIDNLDVVHHLTNNLLQLKWATPKLTTRRP